MPIVNLNGTPLDEQQRAVTIGKIRLGHQVVKRGKTAPEKLDAFRLTSPAEHQIRAAAAAYGGTPTRIESGALAGQWEVYTPCDTLPVVVPNTRSVSQWMEMWSAAGCQRRCDGETIRMRGQEHPCMCPKDPQVREAMAARGNACRPVTRVSLVLPDLPGMAVWVVESHGINAALEMAQVALSIGLAAERGSFLPAQIRMDHRETRIPSRDPDKPPQVSKFVVPVLEILTSMRQMVEGGTSSGALQLPPAPGEMRAIGSAPAPTPSARPVEARPARPAPAPDDDEPVDAELIYDDAPPAGETAVWPDVTPPGGLGVTAEDLARRAENATSIGQINDLIGEAQQAGVVRAKVGPDGRTLQALLIQRARTFSRSDR